MKTIFALVEQHNSWMDRKEIIQSYLDNPGLVTKIWANNMFVELTETALRHALITADTIELVQCERRLKIVFKRIAGNEYEWVLLPA